MFYGAHNYECKQKTLHSPSPQHSVWPFFFLFFPERRQRPTGVFFCLWKFSNGDIKGAVSSHPERAHIQAASSHWPVTSSQSHHIVTLRTTCVWFFSLGIRVIVAYFSLCVFVYKTLFRRWHPSLAALMSLKGVELLIRSISPEHTVSQIQLISQLCRYHFNSGKNSLVWIMVCLVPL